MSPQVCTDQFINNLFQGSDFGVPTNQCVIKKREQLAKTLQDQIGGYWSGSTAYHIAVHGGFLKDAKSGIKKKLTALGETYLAEFEGTEC